MYKILKIVYIIFIHVMLAGCIMSIFTHKKRIKYQAAMHNHKVERLIEEIEYLNDYINRAQLPTYKSIPDTVIYKNTDVITVDSPSHKNVEIYRQGNLIIIKRKPNYKTL